MSAPAPSMRARVTRTDWDKLLTDGAIYLLALGGFYVGFKTLYSLALMVGYPTDEAMVVASLADIAILAYSRKAVREVKAGRSAWAIRLIVAAFSLGTFALQLRSAWPHPVSVGFHILPPAVWIIGHEMMLRGELRQAKKQLREHEIAQGLRPTPLPRLRRTWWLLDPYHTFTVWRLTKLWEQSPTFVILQEAARREHEGETIPRAWQGVLATGGQDEDEVRDRFIKALPPVPEKGSRTNQEIAAFITRATQLAGEFDIECTGKLLADILDCDPAQVSRIRTALREGKFKRLALTSA
ncbi:DUF2637 domain-containing protein [Streptomyces sp. NPDC005562]|uniref:DUF2637 domain-containing protein n=1 Tax=Streptomyces sp. NPDC005562 TaxID=3154890 RepID=UPI0033B67EA4